MKDYFVFVVYKLLCLYQNRSKVEKLFLNCLLLPDDGLTRLKQDPYGLLADT